MCVEHAEGRQNRGIFPETPTCHHRKPCRSHVLVFLAASAGSACKPGTMWSFGAHACVCEETPTGVSSCASYCPDANAKFDASLQACVCLDGYGRTDDNAMCELLHPMQPVLPESAAASKTKPMPAVVALYAGPGCNADALVRFLCWLHHSLF